MSTTRLRLFVVICLALATAAAVSRADSPATESEATTAALLPNGLRARIPDAFSGDPASVLADPARDRLYIATDAAPYTNEESALYAIDTRQAALLTTVEDVELYHLTLSQDGTRLIGYTPYPETEPGRLLVFDAGTLALVDDFTLTCAPGTDTCSVADMAAGPDGRLYWISYGDSLVNVLDVATGNVIDRFVAADDTPVNRIEIAGANLFAFEGVDNNNSRQIRRYDISTAAAALALTAPDEFGGHNWLAAPDGSYLIADGPFGVKQYNTETLLPTRTIFDGGWQQRIGGLAISPDSERVIIMVMVLNENQPLYGYDARTGEPVITGMVDVSHIGYPGNSFPMAALGGGGLAVGYAGFVDLFFVADHAAAVPVVFANHCGRGPFLDSFTHVNSGWPSGATDGLVFGYVDDQYTILQQDADRWFGVSRGDKWIDGRVAAVATRLTAADGYSGLIYGLNADWNLFYTFEVIPSLDRWVVFEFREDIGWTLLLTGISHGIAPVGEWNRLTMEHSVGDENIFLYVNGSFVGMTPNRDGRIGLSAASFEPDFEARFDNYEFVGQNCRLYSRDDTADIAPSLTRPPLDDFLR